MRLRTVVGLRRSNENPSTGQQLQTWIHSKQLRSKMLILSSHQIIVSSSPNGYARWREEPCAKVNRIIKSFAPKREPFRTEMSFAENLVMTYEQVFFLVRDETLTHTHARAKGFCTKRVEFCHFCHFTGLPCLSPSSEDGHRSYHRSMV